MDILFKGITAVTMNPDAPVLTDINLGIEGRKITYLEPASGTPSLPLPKAKRTIDGTNKVLMPGMYNFTLTLP